MLVNGHHHYVRISPEPQGDDQKNRLRAIFGLPDAVVLRGEGFEDVAFRQPVTQDKIDAAKNIGFSVEPR